MNDQAAVLLFSGQGAQAVGMGRGFVESGGDGGRLLAQADEILGWSLGKAMFEGPIEELTRTSRCQPALYLHGLMGLDYLKKAMPDLEIVGVAGLSLGEFTAHAAAGTFDFETGLRLVAKRGQFMEEATDGSSGGMAAMIGGDEAAVVELARECDVDVANYNAPGQIVLSGSEERIAKAVAGAKGKGIKGSKTLTVAGAYHSRMMKPAQDQLAQELQNVELKPPQIPVVCNVEARQVSTADEIRSTLVAQVTGSVRWSQSMRVFLDQGITRFIELGPGGVLAGLMKRIDRNATVVTVEDPATLEIAVEALRDVNRVGV